jgi:hypothetical protein
MNNKLIEILKHFDEKKYQSLLLFTEMPLFAINKSVTSFFLSLKNYAPNYNVNQNDEHKIYGKIFTSTYNINNFRNLQTQAYKVLLEFLAHTNFQKSNFSSYFYLQEVLDVSLDIAEKELTLLKKEGLNDELSYLNQFLSNSVYFDFVQTKSAVQGRKTNQANEQGMFMLDCFYLKNKLQYGCQLINQQGILQAKIPLNDYEELANDALSEKFKNESAIKMYALSYLLLKKQELSYFSELKSYLFNDVSTINIKDLKAFFAIAQNFCIRQFNAGKSEFLQVLFEIYKKSLDQKVLIENGVILPSTYKNLIIVSLRLKEFEWTESFIEKNSQFLPENERENAQSFSFAMLYFAKGKYQKVINMLSQIQYTDAFYQLDAKKVLAKAYYELDEMETLQSLTESFNILLYRHKKIAAQHLDLYRNFNNVLKKLIGSTSTSKVKMKKLLEELEAKPVADKTWVVEKINELI